MAMKKRRKTHKREIKISSTARLIRVYRAFKKSRHTDNPISIAIIQELDKRDLNKGGPYGNWGL